MKYFSLKQVHIGKLLLYLFTVSIYLPMIFTNIISILLVLFVIKKHKTLDFSTLINNQSVVVMTAFYFLIFTGLLYDINSQGVLNDLEKKLSFLVLPIAISLIKVNKQDLQKILGIFFFSGFFFASIAFFISIYNFINTGDYNAVINHSFSNAIGLHATYLSMYLLFSFSYPLLYLKRITKLRERQFVFLISICMLTYILLLSVRIIWLLLFVVLILKGISLFKKNHRNLSFSIIGALLFSVVLIYSVNPLKERFKELVNYNSEYNVKEAWGGRAIRVLIWQSCGVLIKQAPFTGYGSSIEVQKQLDNIYRQNKIGPLLFLMNNRGKVFNPHNQYLEEVLKFGALIGLFFIVFLGFFMKNFHKKKNEVGLLFLIIIMGVSLTETILELNKGIIFFSFFFPVLYSYCRKQKNQDLK